MIQEANVRRVLLAVLGALCSARNELKATGADADPAVGMGVLFGRYVELEEPGRTDDDGVAVWRPFQLGGMPKLAAQILIRALSQELHPDWAALWAEAWTCTIDHSEELSTDQLHAMVAAAGGVRHLPGATEALVVNLRLSTGRSYGAHLPLPAGARLPEDKAELEAAVRWIGFGTDGERQPEYDVFLDEVVFRPLPRQQ